VVLSTDLPQPLAGICILSGTNPLPLLVAELTFLAKAATLGLLFEKGL
jgi:hypothetical protein